MSYSEPYYPGLASSTGTRVDSAAKHNLACKVDSDLIRSWVGSEHTSAEEEVRRNKYKFAMQKDELVMNTGTKIDPTSAVTRTKTQAYPAVVTTMADCCSGESATAQQLQKKLIEIYSMPTCARFFHAMQKNQLTKFFNHDDFENNVYGRNFWTEAYWGTGMTDDKAKRYIENMPMLRAQGYALGTAYASALSGDTVGTVIIGGVVTVMNGGFEMRAGQEVQWYFSFEDPLFRKTNDATGLIGSRVNNQILRPDSITRPFKVQRRQDYHDRMFGMKPGDQNKGVFKIKPYVESISGPVYGDRVRVFAKCVTGGRAYDHVDIMLMTQSL